MSVARRAELSGLSRYRPGLRPSDARTAISSQRVVKLSSNELALPPLPSVQNAIQAVVSEINRYPEAQARDLVDALAAHLGIAAGQVAVDAGSSALCRAAIAASVSRGDSVMFGYPSFEIYERFAVIAGARPAPVPLEAGLTYDLDAMLGAVCDTTRAIFVCNPNNPTSTEVPINRLRSFVSAVPNDVLIVIDEAYREFAHDSNATSGSIELLDQHDNVLLLRTFSKAYGLADLRVGYAIGAEDFVTELHKVIGPFSVSTLAQAAAIDSLQHGSELADRIERVISERSRITASLRDLAIPVVDSSANFVGSSAVSGGRFVAQQSLQSV